jgi:POT family proton-dependent oligopeptide transporter
MWERFSYYGMRAILILFMTAALMGDNPGMGLTVGVAAAVYGLYTSLVYLLSLPGGWVADNIWGQKRAVFVGGIIIMCGHISLAVPTDITFYLGLVLIVLGTGLLKPNVSTMVGDLYPEGGARRDAGFSIFYMGINIGALLGTAIVSWVGEQLNFHIGFSLAAIGMFFGLIQYRMGWEHLGAAGDLKTGDSEDVVAQKSRRFYMVAGLIGLLVVMFGFLAGSGVFSISVESIANWLGVGIILMSVLFFVYLILGNLWVFITIAFAVVVYVALVGILGVDDPQRAGQIAVASTVGLFVLANIGKALFYQESYTLEKQRLMVIFWLFILAAIFWAGFEQAGSSLNLFARDLTDRVYFGWEMPAGWLQNINPFFIIVFAPVFGWLWTWLAQRKLNPSIPLKFALGLFGLAVGFFVLSWGSANATPESPVSPAWLVVTYFFHTAGELCLSPIGLSSMTKLAPKNRVGQMMGVWFIAAGLGNLVAGLVAGNLESLAPSALFWNIAAVVAMAGVVALLASPFVRRLTHGID